MTTKKRPRAWLWLVALAAMLVAASPAVAASSPAALEVDEAGTYVIYSIDDLAPGASISKHWNFTPQGLSHRVDVWPKPNPLALGVACEMEVVRTWKSMTNYFDSPSELELHWTVKNVGASTCDGDVYLVYVNP
ncbi:hypothetical protein ACFXGA_39885 [Actinosynnema sp. NPDC059335]|uniref:hypothetical protein n=1 Tax=Actinosynnema sp. NPDC059335 TaxID=3346804 RepID=UPI00366E71B0